MKGRVARLGIFGMGLFVCAATLIPLLRKRRGWIRAFDFPRMQIFAIGTGVLAVGWRQLRAGRGPENVLLGAVGLALAGQALQIYPYTRFARKEVLPAGPDEPGRELTLLFFNVLQSNREYRRLLELIEENDPEMILLTETDGWWADKLKPLEQRWKYVVRQPQENTYGMMLFSRLPLIDPEVRFLVQEDIPSIRTKVEIEEGQQILFYGVHPKPPGEPLGNGSLRPSGPRDGELAVIAKELREKDEAVIVAGDFNDVAWSHSTRLFKRVSRTLDPRVGRGFYNTFPVRWRLLRYPLDHMFHSDDFKLVDFQLLREAGSDHFPVLATLRLTPSATEEQEPVPADGEDKKEARELADEWGKGN